MILEHIGILQSIIHDDHWIIILSSRIMHWSSRIMHWSSTHDVYVPEKLIMPDVCLYHPGKTPGIINFDTWMMIICMINRSSTFDAVTFQRMILFDPSINAVSCDFTIILYLYSDHTASSVDGQPWSLIIQELMYDRFQCSIIHGWLWHDPGWLVYHKFKQKNRLKN